MSTIVMPERFTGQYHGVIPPQMLEAGSICGGKNIRKVSQQGGWKPRKGCTLHDTSAMESGAACKSLHYYTNPFYGDEFFIAQCNSKLLVQSAQNVLPPTVDTSFGVDLGVTVGTTPGFSAFVGEYMFYADGSGRPVAYGGGRPRVKGFFVYDISTTTFTDYTRKVTDGRSDTHGHILGAATDYFIVITEERCDGVVFDLSGTTNTESATLTVQAWRSGTWTGVSGTSDGTINPGPGSPTLYQDGTVSWTRSASDTLYSYRGIQGYAYKFTWSIALTGTIQVDSLNCLLDADNMTNKWNGEINWVTGCRFFDVSVGNGLYSEALGKVTNEAESTYVDMSLGTSTDFLYLKTPEPATMFAFAVPKDYTNIAGSGKVDSIEYWNGSGWTAITTNLEDETLDPGNNTSFTQTGNIVFDGNATSPERSLLDGDSIPGYWYRLSWGGTMAEDTRIYAIGYGAFPDALPAYDGCVEFKGRLLVWGDPEYPNRLRYSAKDNPFCFSGVDSGYTDSFGAQDAILCAVKFYNELIVFKKNEVWLLEGEGPASFGTLKITDKVGLASPKSVQVAEVGFPALHRDEPMTIAIWQDIDGVYTFDGRKTKKESYPVDNYFNAEKSECIVAASIRTLQAFSDRTNNEYHLLLPDVELVFNYVTAEWYPPWDRKIILSTGLDFRATDNRHYTYGASALGWIMRLETDTSDKTVANADEPIEHSLKTRAVGYQKVERLVRFTLRKVWAELKSQSAGAIATRTHKDLQTTGVLQATPQAMTMINTGYEIIEPRVEMSIEDIRCFQAEFKLDVIDQEMEIYGFAYEIAGAGLSEQ